MQQVDVVVLPVAGRCLSGAKPKVAKADAGDEQKGTGCKLGDLFFALVNLACCKKMDAGLVLRETNENSNCLEDSLLTDVKKSAKMW